MKNEYTTDELFFAPEEEVYSWKGHTVQLLLKNEKSIFGVISKILHVDDSKSYVSKAQFLPVAIVLAGYEREILFDSIKTMKIIDL